MLLLAHFALRGLMHEAALKAHVDPDTLSFVHSGWSDASCLAWCLFPPQERIAFHETVLEEILEERVSSSRGRCNPRAVKRKMSSFPVRSRIQGRTGRPRIQVKILK